MVTDGKWHGTETINDQRAYRVAVSETGYEYRLIVEPTERETRAGDVPMDWTFLADSEEAAMRGAERVLRENYDEPRTASLYRAVTRLTRP